MTHHNYYGFDGHHEMPVDPKAFQRGNRAQAEVAFWRHLEPSSWVFNVTSLNRPLGGMALGWTEAEESERREESERSGPSGYRCEK